MIFQKIYRQAALLTGLLLLCRLAGAQVHLLQTADSVVLNGKQAAVVFHRPTGKVSYRYANGTRVNNTIASVDDKQLGYWPATAFNGHNYSVDTIQDALGNGCCLHIVHERPGTLLRLVQHITIYDNSNYVLIAAEVETTNAGGFMPAVRLISPLSLLVSEQGSFSMPGAAPRFTDFPFDNDNWVDVVTRAWKPGETLQGISHELAAVYDTATMAGMVTGSLQHDCWKTGIRYVAGKMEGGFDSLVIYGGASTPDNSALPGSFGGYDGTHDVMPHGIVSGETVQGPLLYLAAGDDVRSCYRNFGVCNTAIAGSRQWKGPAPVYWNSFGVEGVLGYEKVMMPAGVLKVADGIAAMKQFNSYAQPVLSIDSYDQDIYTTDILKEIGRYGKKKGQQIGFYFIPFATWTWTNNTQNTRLKGSDYTVAEVILKDAQGNFIPYKKGDWGAFPLDPTHPATRLYIINQLQKAKAIGATFIKIDFLSAGSLEAATHYDPAVQTGMQAYARGMKMLKKLTDSIMGPDVFVTQAISPMFPHQYAHTRFVSTDVYSHLRNDQAGFPHYGSTAASMISAASLWWMQGTLWPYTNMDVIIMKHFQKHPDLNEQEIKVRLYSMITLGSILGDGSDLREKLAVERAGKFLNHAAVAAFFSAPKAFTPLNFPEGNSMDQQLHFYLPGDTVLLSAFNFHKTSPYTAVYNRAQLGLAAGSYRIVDFLTGQQLGAIGAQQQQFTLQVPVTDAVLVKLVP